MGDGFYRSKDPTNSIKVLKEQIVNHTYNKQTWTQNTASPLVYNNMGWVGDGSHRGQGCQAWTAVGLPSRYPQYGIKNNIYTTSVSVMFEWLFADEKPVNATVNSWASRLMSNDIRPFLWRSTKLEINLYQPFFKASAAALEQTDSVNRYWQPGLIRSSALTESAEVSLSSALAAV